MVSNLKTKKAIVCFLFLVSFFLIHSVSFAGPVTFDRAMQVADNWMLQQTGIEHQAFEDSITFSRDDFQDYITPYYIFNMDPGGWVIVSGDDIAYPIIGYSVQGAVDAEDVPPAFIEWMALIEEEIREEVNNDSEPLLSIETAWEKLDVTDYEVYRVSDEAVSPLIQTTWSQGQYYNANCPVDYDGPDDHALVGCVATAAGQIMKHHNWPVTGSGSHSYYHSTYGTLSANFGATTYNWGSMPASGQLTSYNTAVATMLYHVGVSVDMNYGPSGSGAVSSTVPAALRTYFKYNANDFVNRSSYTTSAWLSKLTSDHNAGRPVYYRSPGHAFICDGYTGTDYFHFNWGWNGSYDGYYYLNDLTPGSRNYNSNQGGNFGIYPAGGTPGAQVTSLWPISGANCGETSRLWAQVNNNGSVNLPSGADVWYWVDGPSWSGSNYVGHTSVSGLTPGSTSWYYNDWSIPSTRASGTHTYWARVWDSSSGTWLSAWSSGQTFDVSCDDVRVTSLWPISGANCGETSRLWAQVNNNGSVNLPSGADVWYWVDGPSWSGSNYVGHTSVSGLTPGSTSWYYNDWSIPSTRSGTHTYWARVWDSSSGTWLSAWSSGQTFDVSCDDVRVTSLWPISGANCGETSRLWAQVNNNGSVNLPSGADVWYWVDGPSWSGSNYVGHTSVSGLTPGSTSWYYNDWSIPSTRSGTHTYWARVWDSSSGTWLGAWSSGQTFDVSCGGFNSQFKGSATGWESHSGVWYVNNEYLYTEGLFSNGSSVSYNATFTNFDYQVRLWRSAGCDTCANRIKVRGTPTPLWGTNHWDTGYTFQYTRDGSYMIYKSANGSTTVLKSWTSSSAINTGSAWNTLRVVADGTTISFYINGTYMGAITNTSLTSGRVGIGVYSTGTYWVDWATLTTSASASDVPEASSVDHFVIDDSLNRQPLSEEEMDAVNEDLQGVSEMESGAFSGSEGMMEGPSGFDEMFDDGPPDAAKFQDWEPPSVDQGEGLELPEAVVNL